ncbi:cysteine hydrolase [Roseovarius indicus]|uniref:Isochorismatase n=1 Tax=Roseovarius indicus TaxID=540747 RepID=A0A0T5P5X5_9RHOB|nr:cysteine hydrolase [Roseovarius indicus]KRS16504.1 isochorismatase [Roseovarius indicus]QEW28149.1 putative hydrolase [Roseovarius indicus]SFE55065.1 Nicotinamidase-related amidase [Roseovarius indicus]
MTQKHDHDHDCGCGITPDYVDHARRRVLAGAAGAAVAGAAALAGQGAAAATEAARAAYADPETPGLPQIDMEIDLKRTALVVTDPQVDFLSEEGVTWGVVGESVTEQGTVDNIERLFIAAKAAGMPVFISPHYYYPHDYKWQFEGTLEATMHGIGMFDRPGPLDLTGFHGSGADWMPQYKPYIEDGETVICSPHKVYSPAQNDLNLQLRKRGVDKVILAGMSANLCTQAHLYELLELGFEVAVVRDATAGAKVPEGDGYLAAIINFRMVANGVWWTDDAVTRIGRAV